MKGKSKKGDNDDDWAPLRKQPKRAARETSLREKAKKTPTVNKTKNKKKDEKVTGLRVRNKSGAESILLKRKSVIFDRNKAFSVPHPDLGTASYSDNLKNIRDQREKDAWDQHRAELVRNNNKLIIALYLSFEY